MIARPPADSGLLDLLDSLRRRRALPGEIERALPCGSGGQFSCYRLDLRDGSRYCLKLEKTPGETTHLRREGRFLGAVRSRHTPRLLLDACADGFVVEEWVAGVGFEGVDKGRLRAAAADICRGLARLLEDLADGSPAVVHRDIKPRNLMLRRLEPVLLDFGSAELEGCRTGGPARPPHKLGRGTHEFQPLEQLLALPTQDRRVDVFAAGSVVFWIFFDRPPYANTCADAALAHRAYLGRQRAIESLLAGWPRPLGRALLHTLRVDPAERASHLGELAAALGSLPG